jgi:cbb3-type cytochrome oxidase maturation protein
VQQHFWQKNVDCIKYFLHEMSAIFILIGASLFVAIGFLVAFLWAVKNGQFEDKHTPPIRMLFEDKNNLKNK